MILNVNITPDDVRMLNANHIQDIYGFTVDPEKIEWTYEYNATVGESEFTGAKAIITDTNKKETR
jgi:hypothetical protein